MNKQPNPLQAERKQLGWTQADLAALLGCSPRTVTSLEALDAEEVETHRNFRKYWKLFLEKRDMHTTAIHKVAPQESERYSFRQETYDLLVANREVENQVNRIIVEADFFPLNEGSRDVEVRFAKHYMTVSYEGLSTEDSDGLLMDAVGNPEGPKGSNAELHLRLVEPSEGSIDEKAYAEVYNFYDDLLKKSQPKVIRFDRFPRFQYTRLRSDYSHVICYELSGADGVDPPVVKLLYYGNHAAIVGENAKDAVGFGLPSDLITGSITIRVTFHGGLRPVPQAAFSRPFKIRRYARSARPDRFNSRHTRSPRMDSDHGVITYTYQINRPKPGYGHVISWRGLEWRKTERMVAHSNPIEVAKIPEGQEENNANS